MAGSGASLRGRGRLLLGEYENENERYVGLADRRAAKACWRLRHAPLPAGARLRRVWRPRRISDLRARLGDGESAIWAEGDVLEVLFRGRAERVDCSGGIQLAMWRVGRSDLWELSVRVQRLESAVISVVPLPLLAGEDVYGRTLDQAVLRFRGPHAPSAAPEIDNRAEVVQTALDGAGIGGPRAVCAWRPASAKGALPVVVCADSSAAMLARTVGAAIEDGALRPILLVGIESGHVRGSVDRRAQEYLPGFSRRRFAAHERWVLEQVLPWAEREHGATRDPSRRFALGFSNGATWALAMAQRHPATFGGAAAFSVAGGAPRRVRHHPGQRYALLAGTLEPWFQRTTTVWAAALRRDPATVVAHRDHVAGHDFQLWLEQAPWAVGMLTADAA